MTDITLADARQQLAQLRAQLADAEAALALIRANGDPRLADTEAKTRQQIETLTAWAEALAQRFGTDPARALH
jgi:F0F1-type ATP synthase membrane subunit b/b'